jgi:tripartite-type tricarboxylate transporter receptor subunit TctC
MKRLLAVLLAFACGIGNAWPADPNPLRGHSVRVIVGFAAGGGADLSARLVMRRMSQILGANFVIENRGGAGGIVAAQTVAAAKPDGNTLLWGSIGAFALSPAIGTKEPFNPLTDFAPISRTVTLCNVMVSSSKSSIKSVQDLIADARKAPGTLTYGTPGVGSAGDTSGMLLLKLANIQMTHVPFKGGSEVATNLFVGDLSVGFVTVSTVQALGKDRLQPLAVTGAQRDPSLPDVPTFAEAGVKGYDATFWYGLFAPKGTPQPVVDALNAAVRQALDDPAVQKAHAQLGVVAAPDSPAEFAALIRADNQRWTQLMSGR